MNDPIRIYCTELGAFHGEVNPRPHWIDTFQRTESSWETTPPARSRTESGSQGEILHRTSEVAVTTEGFALRYAFKYAPSVGQRWGGPPRKTVNHREIIRVPIDLRTGAEYEAELGQDYEIDHVTYEMRCRCGKAISVRRERLHQVLDQVAASHATDDLPLSLLQRIVQLHS